MQLANLERFLLNLFAGVAEPLEEVAVGLHECFAVFKESNAFRAGDKVSAGFQSLNEVLLLQLCAFDLVQRQLDEFGAFELEEVLQELVEH